MGRAARRRSAVSWLERGINRGAQAPCHMLLSGTALARIIHEPQARQRPVLVELGRTVTVHRRGSGSFFGGKTPALGTNVSAEKCA